MDDFVAGALALKVCTLSLEVGLLMGGADTGVTNATSSFRFVGRLDTEEGSDVSEAVAPLARPTTRPDRFNLTLIRPVAESAWADIVCLADSRAGDELLVQCENGESG